MAVLRALKLMALYIERGIVNTLESMLWAAVAALTAAAVVVLLVWLGAHEKLVDAVR